MKTNIALILMASLVTEGQSLVADFQKLGCTTLDGVFLAAVVVQDEVTMHRALSLGYEPSEAAKTRLAMAQRHGDSYAKRVANVFANRVAMKTWKHDAILSPAEEALVDSRDLALCA